MPWYFKDVDQGLIVCTGGCNNGRVPCPVDHTNAPFNEEWEGEHFFRCEECDFVRPDPYNENTFGVGTVPCEECCAGDRNDTYDGPCEWCGRKDCGAKDRTFPPYIAAYRTAKRYLKSHWSCAGCMAKAIHEAQADADAWHQMNAAIAAAKKLEDARIDEAMRIRQRYPKAGTCDLCGSIRPLSVTELEADLYVCHVCAPDGELPDLATFVPAERGAANAEPGWYPAGLSNPGLWRYWNGRSWSGEPVDHNLYEQLTR